MLSSGMITPHFFIFPENFTHSNLGLRPRSCLSWNILYQFSVQYLCSVSEMIKSNRNDVLMYFIQIFWENVHVLIAMSLIVLLATLIVFMKVLYRSRSFRQLTEVS